MRCFEKIEFEEFKKYYGDDLELYNSYSLPKRTTSSSAGYDFKAINDFSIKPGDTLVIPTGIRVQMNNDEMLMLVVRSSTGFKYNVRLTNQIGIIESDYYKNESNGGHMFARLQNHGDKEYNVKRGESYIQGVFAKFLTVDNEEDDFIKRTGGIGSTDRKDDK